MLGLNWARASDSVSVWNVHRQGTGRSCRPCRCHGKSGDDPARSSQRSFPAQKVNYPGSKNAANAYRAIINQMPPHDIYVEGFGGSAAVAFHKRPAAANYVIEINPKVAAAAQSRLTAAAAAVDGDCEGPQLLGPRNTWHFIEGDVFRVISPDSWVTAELRRAGKRALCYFDPPYLISTRSSKQLRYEFEAVSSAAEDDEPWHGDLLKGLLALGRVCHVIISHYRCPFYDKRLKGWRRVDFRTGSRGGLKVESLYCNFADPAVLHDYRFAGADKDRRQRLKRRIATLQKELAGLPAVEANAIRQAIAVRETAIRAGELQKFLRQ